MRPGFLAGLYTAAAVLANPAGADPGALEALREGDMRKLAIHAEPLAASDRPFLDEAGVPVTLDAYAGQVVVLNFWATWCAPCRAEMPTLSALQDRMGGHDLQVVTVATGRNQPQAIRAFFDETGVANLPLHTDPQQQLARDMGVLGLPVTVILDREGREVARLTGEADWASDSAQAILAGMMAGN